MTVPAGRIAQQMVNDARECGYEASQVDKETYYEVTVRIPKARR